MPCYIQHTCDDMLLLAERERERERGPEYEAGAAMEAAQFQRKLFPLSEKRWCAEPVQLVDLSAC